MAHLPMQRRLVAPFSRLDEATVDLTIDAKLMYRISRIEWWVFHKGNAYGCMPLVLLDIEAGGARFNDIAWFGEGAESLAHAPQAARGGTTLDHPLAISGVTRLTLHVRSGWADAAGVVALFAAASSSARVE